MTHSFYRSYGFLAAMLACIVLGLRRRRGLARGCLP